MKKKVLIIQLINDREITRDITNTNVGAPIGADANDFHYATLCQQISQNGYTDPDLVNENLYTHIAPSQIKTVSVKFETL